MTTKKEKKSNSKFSRMDDSELSDIKSFFKNLYYDKNGEVRYDKNFDPYEDEEKKPFLKVLILINQEMKMKNIYWKN